MNENIDSDNGFRFLSSVTQHNVTVNYDPKPRKKRTKVVKVDVGQFPTCSSTTVSRPKYAKKPDPAAPKITRPCTECGKKFWSWKALFGHMRCHPERQWRGINPPPNYCRPVKAASNVETLMTEDDHEIAASLLMLANGSTASESECGTSYRPEVQETEAFSQHLGANIRFECSSCKKGLASHQALGGQWASHKNVKGCFAITRSEGYDVKDHSCDEDKMMMVLGHKCSICWKLLSSGQALGGHKRYHWGKGDDEASSLNLLTAKEDCGLDLNLPPAALQNDSYPSGLALDLRLSL